METGRRSQHAHAWKWKKIWVLTVIRRRGTQLSSLENQTLAQASWPVVFVTLSLSTLLSMTFLTLLLSMVEISVAHQFAYVFTKSFENFIGFIIWWNFFLNIFQKIAFKSLWLLLYFLFVRMMTMLDHFETYDLEK